MSSGNWNDVIQLAIAIVSREHPFAQALTYEGAIFAIVMFLEGLRVSFWPRRVTAEEHARLATLAFAPKASYAHSDRDNEADRMGQ